MVPSHEILTGVSTFPIMDYHNCITPIKSASISPNKSLHEPINQGILHGSIDLLCETDFEGPKPKALSAARGMIASLALLRTWHANVTWDDNPKEDQE